MTFIFLSGDIALRADQFRIGDAVQVFDYKPHMSGRGTQVSKRVEIVSTGEKVKTLYGFNMLYMVRDCETGAESKRAFGLLTNWAVRR